MAARKAKLSAEPVQWSAIKTSAHIDHATSMFVQVEEFWRESYRLSKFFVQQAKQSKAAQDKLQQRSRRTDPAEEKKSAPLQITETIKDGVKGFKVRAGNEVQAVLVCRAHLESFYDNDQRMQRPIFMVFFPVNSAM